MSKLNTAIEGAPSGEGNPDQELLNFWDRGNLKKIFEAEAAVIAEVHKKVKSIENDYNAGQDALKLAFSMPKDKKAKTEALDAEKDKKTREALAPLAGRFLEKLWSALDYQIRERSNEIARTSGKPPEVRPEAAARMEDFYKKIWGGLAPESGDARATVPTVEDRIKLAEEMRGFGEILVAGRNFAPKEIDKAARENETRALAELKAIKQSPAPDFGVNREAGFVADLDTDKMPPFTAVSTLRDYKEHLKKFDSGK